MGYFSYNFKRKSRIFGEIREIKKLEWKKNYKRKFWEKNWKKPKYFKENIFKWKNMSQNILYGIDGIDDVFTDLENEGNDAKL